MDELEGCKNFLQASSCICQLNLEGRTICMFKRKSLWLVGAVALVAMSLLPLFGAKATSAASSQSICAEQQNGTKNLMKNDDARTTFDTLEMHRALNLGVNAASNGSTISSLGLPTELNEIITLSPEFQAMRSEINGPAKVYKVSNGVTFVAFDRLPRTPKGPVAVGDALIFVVTDGKILGSYRLEASLDGSARLIDAESGVLVTTTQVKLPQAVKAAEVQPEADLCWHCTRWDVHPGHLDQNCYIAAEALCAVIGGNVAARAACQAAAFASCWVPDYQICADGYWAPCPTQ
ncbi:MAG: hypothetical protein IMW91_10655 [Firmicutes bacterium]|nr:hypothetical protein [Bacillota bacterium]